MFMVQDGTSLKAGSDRTAAPESATAVFPLSLLQESLWAFEQVHPGTSVYNLPQAWRLTGPLNPEALRAAIETVLRRHESLRTIMAVRGGAPAQIVLPPRPFSLPQTDLSESVDPERRIGEALDQEARSPFDLSGSLARWRLFRLSPDDHVLLVNLHHIIADEWSLKLLFSELAAHYRAFLSGSYSILPELPIQYGDFSVWQRGVCTPEFFEEQLAYWRARLRPPLPVLALPSDHPRPCRPSHRGATLFSALPTEVLARLKDVARSERTTLFMVLAAAFAALLHRCTRQTDILIGSPMAGRERTETEGLIGFFINTLPLRMDVSGDLTFLQLLKSARETVLGAYAHQEVPLERVMEAVQPQREQGRHPLFPVVFGLQPALNSEDSLPGLEVTRLDLDNGGAKFDWSLLVTEIGQTLHLRSEYSTDLFERSTVASRLRHLENLLRAVGEHPTQRLSRLPLLSEAERCRLLGGTRPKVLVQDSPACLHEWFARQAHASPDAVALTFGTQTLSYRELDARANQLAHYLQAQGVGPEITVALYLERSLEMIVAILGVLKAGGAYVPIDPGYPRERLEFILQDSGARLVLTQASLRPALSNAAPPLVCLDSPGLNLEAHARTAPPCRVQPCHAAYTIYTSGSTGRPKGVIVTHQNVTRLFLQTQSWFDFVSSDVWTLFHSYAFDFSVWEIWGALLYGGRLVVVPYVLSRSPGEFYQLLAKEGVTVLNQTPSAFRQLIWADQAASSRPALNLRYIICGGEALALESLKPWFERYGDTHPTIVNMYGITETTVHVTYHQIKEADLRKGAGSLIGIPIPDLNLYLLDENLEPVPLGIPGEICVGGAGVARGYLNRPELTAQRFIADPFSREKGGRLYRSGDLARYTFTGDLEYLGRMDGQVKIRGFRIELGEIESALNRHPGVRESAVISQDTGDGGPRLVAYLVPSRLSPSTDALRAALQQSLPEYMIPSSFVWLENLPLTANGKLDRNALPAPTPVQEKPAGAPPQSPLEKATAEIWCQLLGRSAVGIHDNFFQLGGHSLLATQVMSRLAASLKTELSVGLLFEAPTIASLAEAIGRTMQERPVGISSIPRRNLEADPRELLARLDELSDEEIDELLHRSAETKVSP